MFRTILVPLDELQFGEHALPLALAIAERAEGTIHLVHVHSLAAPLYSGSEVAADLAFDSAIREQEHDYLEQMVRRLEKVSSVPVTFSVLESPVARGLSEHAAYCGADLIVMSTHGRSALARACLGSVGDHIIHNSPCPVFLVRPNDEPVDLAKRPALKRVLIPLDGSHVSEQILESALAIGSHVEAEYTLLRVIQPLAPALGNSAVNPLAETALKVSERLRALDKDLERSAEAYLQQVADRLRACSHRVQTCVIRHARPATCILNVAKRKAIDFIALETRCRGPLARMFWGSVADKVVRAASKPVLVNHPLITRAKEKTNGHVTESKTCGARESSSHDCKGLDDAEPGFDPGCCHGQGSYRVFDQQGI